MGVYEQEMALVNAGKAERGKACRDYFAELDAAAPEELTIHRPDYSKTLFAPENDDIYREFCAFLDQPEPRFYDTVENPISIEGYTAADVYRSMIANNQRLTRLDAAAVYSMLIRLRNNPELGKKLIYFHPNCSQCGPSFERNIS